MSCKGISSAMKASRRFMVRLSPEKPDLKVQPEYEKEFLSQPDSSTCAQSDYFIEDTL